ncbi:galactoside alpha-(1,2)-fucosyltransferase 2-like isoform X2 [Mixophyes fleayi]|uniref:galactoside alpha-(1,2)-fucosyltransferase 2-like isoform X2 n=1 Tax=Mixophyes fleayi TaxID=3061075 RepID=UPI003F4DFC28
MSRYLPKTVLSLLTIFMIGIISYWYYDYGPRRLEPTFQKTNNAVNSCRDVVVINRTQPRNLKSETVMWTAHPSARLGNKMGEYAALYALAKLNGHQAYVLPVMHSELGKIFKIKLPVLDQEAANRINWKGYTLSDWMSPEYSNISGQYVKLFGTPCSWTFYHHIREEILQQFTFHDYIKEQANSYLSKLKGDRKNVTFIGVHVRRGDYVHVMANLRKGVVADKGYMQKAMDYFRNKYENPLFVVTSNGMDWCKNNIDNSLGDVHFAGDGQEGSPARDFALLVHCNHTIMTIGTFGYWAAYLVGGVAAHNQMVSTM